MLSDAKVIDLLNREYNAVEVNLTDQGFPPGLDGLAIFKNVYDLVPEARQTFPATAVLDAEGMLLLNSGGTGRVVPGVKEGANIFDTSLYLQMLELGLERNHRLEALRDDASLTAEARTNGVAQLQVEISKHLEKVLESDPVFVRAAKLKRK